MRAMFAVSILGLSILFVPRHGLAQETPKETPVPISDEEARALFTWFDGLGPEMAEDLYALADGRGGNPGFGMMSLAARFDGEAGAFLHARRAQADGHPEKVRAFLDETSAIRQSTWWKKGKAYRATLEEDFGDALLHRAMARLTDTSMPRRELVPLLRRITERLPAHSQTPTTRKNADVLARMVTEDASHRAPEGWPDVPVDVQVREWTWRLRDQTGEQWSHPGSCDIFDDLGEFVSEESGHPRTEGTTPAHHLVRLGSAAVPALVEAWDDGRITRAFDCDVFYDPPFRVLTVGEAAHQVLARITGLSFKSKADAVSWYAKVKEGGLDEILAEGIRAGGKDAAEQAEALAMRSPKAAMDALVAGIAHCADAAARAAMVCVLGRMEGDAPVPVLLAEAAGSPSLAARVVAARALQERGRPEAVPSMLAAWKTATPDPGLEDLIEFLAASGDPGALRAMAGSIALFPANWRILAAEAIHIALDDARFSKRTFTPEWRGEAERLLVGLLLDRENWPGGLRSIRGLDYRDPRVCDAAALVLGRMRGEPDAIDFHSSPSARDQACVRMANAWRKEHWLDPVPGTKAPVIPRAGPAVEGLLQTARKATDAEARNSALAKLRKEGLPALGSVEAALAEMPADDPAREGLAAVARTLAFTVREATTSSDEVLTPESVSARLDGIAGRPLQTEDVTALLIDAFKTLPPAAVGFELLLERPEAGTGVAISLRYFTSAPPEREFPKGLPGMPPLQGWRRHATLLLKGEMLAKSSGSFRKDHLLGEDGWKDLANALGKALEAGPREPVEMRVRLSRE